MEERKMAQKSPDTLVGERLKMARKSMGYTQEELSRIFQIGRPRYSDIENGKRHLTHRGAVQICRFLSAPLTVFFSTT